MKKPLTSTLGGKCLPRKEMSGGELTARSVNLAVSSATMRPNSHRENICWGADDESENRQIS